MAEGLTRTQVVTAAAALLLSSGSIAQALTDPTRPPLELMVDAAGTGQAGAARAVAGPRLESILLSSTRKGAIINGEYVPLHGAYGKAVLVDITATAASLKTGEQLEVLQLYPPLEHAVAASGTVGKTEKMVKRP